MNITWDAEKYTEKFAFVHQHGAGVMDWIDFEGVRSAIDLGCGNGALTKALRDRGLDVTGIDASGELLAIARERYPDIRFVQADATDFAVAQQVDLVFSNAVFHWIEAARQPHLLSSVAQALKTKGQFVFEFGGQGNNALIHEKLSVVFARHGYPYEVPFYFPSIGEYAPLLERAGFLVQNASLFDRFTQLQGEDGLRDWILMFVKRPFEQVKEAGERDDIVHEAVSALADSLFKDGKWYADYVRLRMKAIRQS